MHRGTSAWLLMPCSVPCRMRPSILEFLLYPIGKGGLRRAGVDAASRCNRYLWCLELVGSSYGMFGKPTQLIELCVPLSAAPSSAMMTSFYLIISDVYPLTTSPHQLFLDPYFEITAVQSPAACCPCASSQIDPRMQRSSSVAGHLTDWVCAYICI